MARYHLKLNLDKLVFIPHRTSPLPELSVTIDGSARNLGVVLDGQLDFKEQVTATSWSCRFLLYNMRRIRLYLTTYSTQLPVQATAHLRTGLQLIQTRYLQVMPERCMLIQPLQLIQNAAAHLRTLRLIQNATAHPERCTLIQNAAAHSNAATSWWNVPPHPHKSCFLTALFSAAT